MSNRPAGTLDAATALRPYAGSWNQRLAAHLLRRAGFGGSPDDVRRIAGMGVHDAVDSFIHFPSTASLPQPDNVFNPLPSLFAIYGAGRMRAMDDMQRREQFRMLQRQSRQSVISMQSWWLNRMLTTPAPLQEKMTLFWHGHFTTAAVQKQVWPSDVYAQNQLYRTHALGNIHELTQAVSKDPAMLKYLDNARSVKGHPNENYARELMELFTLGIGNYTETDIRESARAFTGWTVNRRTGEFLENRLQHDDGVKHFLGKTGNFDGSDIVDIIFAQPAAPKFFATKLLSFFVYDDPEPALVAQVAKLLRKSDFFVAPVLSAILRSNVFFSERAYRARVKSPVEFLVGAYKTFGLQTIDLVALASLPRMGQILFYPPNVKGWDGGRAWLTSQMVLARENFSAGLVNSPMMTQKSWLESVPVQASAAAKMIVANILLGDASAASLSKVQSYLNGAGTSALGMLSGENYQERVRGAAYLTMAMPAYQLN